MNRRRLAVFIGVIVSIAAAVFMLWPSGSADQHIEETSEEAELPEGLVLLGAEQIEASLVRLLRLSGAHAAAAEQYAHYSAVLKEGLGIEPPPLDAL